MNDPCGLQLIQKLYNVLYSSAGLLEAYNLVSYIPFRNAFLPSIGKKGVSLALSLTVICPLFLELVLGACSNIEDL